MMESFNYKFSLRTLTCNLQLMKLITTILIGLLLFYSCQNTVGKKESDPATIPFFVGTYTGDDSQGIYKYLLKPDGELGFIGLAAKSENPSFLTFSFKRKFLLAANEISNKDGVGTIESYSVRGDSLTLINRSSSGGAHPCFVSVNKDAYVLAANYSGGNIGLLKMKKNGELSELLDIQQHDGSGSTERQSAPHAHSAWFDPIDNSVVSVDLGTNELWFSQLDMERNKLMPSYPHRINMEPGAGPRHLAFHPGGDWLYVINELDCTVTLLKKDEQGTYHKGPSVSTLPPDYSETNYCADIHISSDGRFVYASNRGHNSIAIFEVIENSGLLKPVGHESTHGDWPRNFSLSPDEKYLLVANQKSENIVSFERDKGTGLLKYIYQIEALSPVCILF